MAKLPAPINLSTIKPRDIDAHEVRTREDWAARWLSFDPELFTDFPEVLVFTLDQMKVFDVEWKRQDEACERGEIEAINTPQIVDDVRDVLG